MKRLTLTLLTFLLILSPAIADNAVEKIEIKLTSTSLLGDISKAKFEEFLDAALLYANSKYSEHITAGFKNNGSYVLSMQPINIDGELFIQVQIINKKTGASSPGKPFQGIMDKDNSRFLAGCIFTQWAYFHDIFKTGYGKTPLYIDQISAAQLHSEYIGPMSTVVKKNGNIVIGLYDTIHEYNSNLDLLYVYGNDLKKKGVKDFGMKLTLTASEILYSRSSLSSTYYQHIPEYPRTPVIPFSIPLVGTDGDSAIFADGSFAVVDMNNSKVIQFRGKDKKELDIYNSSLSYIGGLYSDFSGNIWAYDTVQQRFKVINSEGLLIDSIQIAASHLNYLSVYLAAVYKDGSIIIFTSDRKLMSFSSSGTLIWIIDSMPAPLNTAIPISLTMSLDSTRGIIYLTDIASQKIYRLLDQEYIKRNNINSGFFKTAADLQLNIAENPDEADPIKELAEAYEEEGNVVMAAGYYQMVLDLDPFDFDAEEKFNILQSEAIKRKALPLHEKTIKTLTTIGPENARTDYTELIKLYEQILSMTPDDKETANRKRVVQELFLQESAAPSAKSYPSLKISKFKVDNLFPSLMLTYTVTPVGTFSVKNPNDYTAENIQITFTIPGYMDIPFSIQLEKPLKSGQSKDIDLFAIFNSRFMGIQENIPSAASIEISYNVKGSEQLVSKQTGLTIYRNTSLTWDDTGKLASFITPNEAVVQSFALKALGSSMWDPYPGLPKKMNLAAIIIEAVGQHKIAYIEDPNSPFSGRTNNQTIIDLVRHPRTTLYVQTGDCDDTTALLCSLYEAAGIEAAIMTSPGHVFLAFNTEEPVRNKWLFENDDLSIIKHNGTVWIPIESTASKEGFFAAWKYASRIIKQEDAIEFLPVQTEWIKYPPIPLQESAITVAQPNAAEVGSRLNKNMPKLYTLLYTQGIKWLNDEIKSKSGKRKLRSMNKLAVLHGRFGDSTKAVSVFQQILKKNNEYMAAYLNLANIYIKQNKLTKATAILKDGLKKKPDSSLLNLTLSQCYLKQDHEEKAEQHFAKVEENSPELAEKFSYLFNNSETRAGADFEIIQIWDEGE